jgi:hypothetical protein
MLSVFVFSILHTPQLLSKTYKLKSKSHELKF